MQLTTKDGIACDHCGTTHRHDFTYYSFDFRLVSVEQNRRPPLDEITHSTIIFSLDICPSCYDKMTTEIVKNYQKAKHLRTSTMCELTGNIISGTSYNYYHVNVIKVVVTASKDNSKICSKCKTTSTGDICSNCNGALFAKPANVRLTDRFIEMNISEDSYKKFIGTATQIRQIAGTWSTKS